MARLGIFLLVGLLVSGVDIHLFKPVLTKEKVMTIIKDTCYTNVLSLWMLRFLLDKPFVLNSSQYTTIFSVKYVLFSMMVGGVYIVIKGVLTHTFVWEKRTGSFRKRDVAMNIGSISLFSIGLFLYIGTVWFVGFFGKLTPEQFIFNFNSPVTGTASGVMQAVVNGPVLKFISIVAVFVFAMTTRFTFKWLERPLFTDKVVRLGLSLVAVGTCLFGGYYSMKELQLDKVYEAYYQDSPYIKENYASPKDVNMTFPKKKRNLVHIYLESYENSFFDKSLGGNMEKNLMPDLETLSKEGVHFSETDKMGGPYQTYGSSWSVASMINMSMGLPLKIPMDGNAYGKSGYFLPGAVGIGDILHEQGYNQTIMFGADADFGGLTSFFNGHKDFKIFDFKYAKKEKLIPADYKVWWGYEDKKLYEYAKDELTRLASTDKPFNFTMENADTHFPDGYLEKGAPTPFDSQYANVIAHSQKEVVSFVRWIQEQPFYDNTTIVLTGDHLSMDRNFFKSFSPDYHRTTTNLILNDSFAHTKIQTTYREFAPFDMYPTILSSMGVDIEGNRLGLGTDLSSNEKTLIERDGLDKVESEFSKNSKFYNKEFVSERHD